MERKVIKQIKDLELFEIDFLVAKDEGFETHFYPYDKEKLYVLDEAGNNYYEYSPTTNPSQAWPIIERERIGIEPYGIDKWAADIGLFNCQYGKTSLEAAMRCRVASVHGDEVDI